MFFELSACESGVLAVLTLLPLLTVYRFYKAAVVKCILRGVPGPAPISWTLGNLGQVYDQAGMQFHWDLPRKYGSVAKICGMMGDEQLYVTDPLALHQILVKDQNIFEETSTFRVSQGMLFGTCLLSTIGEQHRRQRKIMNPVFSAAHTKNLTPIFYDITHHLCEVIETRFDNRAGEHGSKSRIGAGAEVDLFDFLSRAALEMIGQCGLGHSFNALDEDDSKMDAYGRAVRECVAHVFKLQVEFIFLPLLVKFVPKWLGNLVVDFYPNKAARELKAMSCTMYDTSKRILDDKRANITAGNVYLESKIGRGKDVMSALLKENTHAAEADRLPDEEIIGQMSLIILGAMDTTATALARVFYLLALQPAVQERLRQEILNARDNHARTYGPGDRDLTYEELFALPLLDAVCRETLRLYPPVPLLARTCREATLIPLARPLRLDDGSYVDSVPVAKNQNIFIGIATSNRDRDVWGDDADEWKPERWLVGDPSAGNSECPTGTKMPEKVAQTKMPGIYSGMLTFLGGNRSCIGFKFSQLEMKIVLAVLIERYKFELPECEIAWKMGQIVAPVVKGRESEGSCMPIRIRPLTQREQV